MAEAQSAVSAVIVTWNVLPSLQACLGSLQPQLQPADEVIVVDNASGDGTEACLRADYPWVRVLQTGANLGFCAAVNRGLAAGRGDYLLVLNPDTELLPGALDAMRALMDRDRGIAVVGPRLLDSDGRPQSSLRAFPTWATLFVESTPFQHVPGLSRLADRFYLADRSDAHVQQVDWVWGACFLVRRQALEEVGGLDEAYFMYSEEVDLCRRLAWLGWEAVFEPAARVVHHHGKSSDQVPAGRLVRFNRSKVLYAAKHFGWHRAEVLRRYLLGLTAGQMGVEAAKLLLGHKPELRRQRIGVYHQVLASELRRLV